MKKLLVLSLALSTALLTAENKVDSSKWKLVWKDEFSKTQLNKKSWTRHKRNKADWANTLSQKKSLLKIKNGILHLKGIVNKDKKDKAPFLTAAINSKGKVSFKYGKVQIRAKFDSAKGAWPALWMLGEKGGWPANGEIDLMEHLNYDDFVYQTVHSKLTVNKGKGPQKSTTVKIDKDDWNTYGCEWDKDKIVFTVNGKVTHTYPRVEGLKDQWPFKQKFYFVLSMQIGGSWVGKGDPKDYPAEMQVDWIRLYKAR